VGRQPTLPHSSLCANPSRTSTSRNEGGTTFYFVTDGIDSALQRAVEGADGKDVRLGGGVATVRKYVKAGLVYEMHLAIIPTLLGTGEHLHSGIDLGKMGYRCVEHVPSARAAHVVLRKQTAQEH